jgi:hypothetical protein
MKKTIALTVALILAAFLNQANAGFPPTTTCTNLGATIEINFNDRAVAILTTRYPSDQIVTLSFDDLIVSETTLLQLPEERRGCTSRSVEFKKITLMRKDSARMPDAYNRLAEGQRLTDDFICATKSAWIAGPGQSCD